MDHLATVEAWGMANGFMWPDSPEPTAPLAERYTWLEDAYDALGNAAHDAGQLHTADGIFLLAAMYGTLACTASRRARVIGRAIR